MSEELKNRINFYSKMQQDQKKFNLCKIADPDCEACQ